MKVTIENIFINYSDEIAEAYFLLINTILLADGEEILRKGIEHLTTKIPLDKYFLYGFGAHHFWVHQRKPTDPAKFFECRLLIVEF